MTKGDTLQIKSTIDDGWHTWSTSNNKIVKITKSSGNTATVQAVGNPGTTATITHSSYGKKDSFI